MADKIVCIDGHSILNRAFYGIPELTNSAGVHTNAVMGFMNIMLKVLDEEAPVYLCVAFDRKEPTFRHEMFGDYKGTRKAMPEELREQVPLIKELLTACGIPIFELPGYEADDILGTISRRAEARGIDAVLLSGDRDLLQLATEHTRIRIPKTRSGMTVTENYFAEDVKAAYQVTPAEFIDLKALMGDASDNIPGVPSIGEKTATALIVAWHSIENLKEHLAEVKPPRAQKALTEHFDMAELSRKLAEICVEAPVSLDWEALVHDSIYTREAYEVLSRLELKALMKRFEAGGLKDARTAAEKPQAPEVSFRHARLGEKEDILSQAKGRTAGFVTIWQEADGKSGRGKKTESVRELQGIALSLAGSGDVYLLTVDEFPGDGLQDFLSALCEAAETTAVMNLKEERKQWELPDCSHFTDIGLALYLLNPLTGSYDTADAAREALGEARPMTRPEDGARILADAVEPLTRKLEEAGMLSLFREIEMPLSDSLSRMEKAGIRVERKALAEYGDNLVEGIRRLEEEIHTLAGHPFNILSPKQLGEILFEEMQLPFAKKTKTGYSTNVDVLEKLKPYHPIAGKVLEYRTLTKLKSTYADGLAAFIGPDERIHGTFHQTITATGRISSADPNLQNIPVRMELGRAIRKVFVPEDGCVFVDADYSQIELRILAHMSGDEKLIEAYRQEQDIHRMTASQVFHVPLEEVTPELRRNA